jgi:hypothetical protein
MKRGIFVQDLTNIIPTKLVFNWPSSSRTDNQNVKCIQQRADNWSKMITKVQVQMLCYLVQIMYVRSRASTEIFIWQKTCLAAMDNICYWFVEIKIKISLETYIQMIGMIRFYLVCLPYWFFVDYIFVRLNLTSLPANNLRLQATTGLFKFYFWPPGRKIGRLGRLGGL